MRIKILFPIFFFLFLSSFLIVNANSSTSYTVELWVNYFSNEQADWTEAGDTPYLNSVGVGNITSTTRYNQEKFFYYEDFSSSYSSITLVELCFYGKTEGNDGINLYLTNSTGEQTVVTSQYLTSSWTWYNYTVTLTLSTDSEIDSGITRFYSVRQGAIMNAVIIDASLIRVTYLVVDYYSFSLQETPLINSNSYKNSMIYKTLVDDTNILYELFTLKNIYFILTDESNILYNLLQYKYIYKYISDNIYILSDLFTNKTQYVVMIEFILSDTIQNTYDFIVIKNINKYIIDISNINYIFGNIKEVGFNLIETIYNIIGIRNPNFIVAPIWINPIYTQPTISNYVIQEYVLLSVVVSMFIALLAIIIVKRR